MKKLLLSCLTAGLSQNAKPSFAFECSYNKPLKRSGVQSQQSALRIAVVCKAVRLRSIPIDPNWNITICEIDRPASIVESYWDVYNKDPYDDISSTTTRRPLLDPFGLVAWPGAIVAARELQQHRQGWLNAQNETVVMVLGAGCGVEAQAAATLGADRVIATDIHPQTLELLSTATKAQGLDHVIVTKLFDITNHQEDKIPTDVTMLIVADVLYNDDLAAHIARRIDEVRQRAVPALVLVTDSQRFVTNDCFLVEQWGAAWETRELKSFCGSGVSLDEDQTYDVKARVLWIGR